MSHLKFKDNDLIPLKEVRIFDRHGNLKKVVSQDRIEDSGQYGINRSSGEKKCRICKKMFTLYRKTQRTCNPCIAKRPLCGISMRRIPLKSEKQMRGHANGNSEI